MIWFTSDYHLFHRNIIRFQDRPFKDIHEMHETIVKNHNEVVGDDDTVYNLGDLSFGSTTATKGILWALKGKIVMIRGNHDKGIEKYADRFEGIYDYLALRKEGIVMFHYPILSFAGIYRGSVHLHGHCVDMKTEILTTTGWKKRNEIKINNKIFSYNIDKQIIEKDKILNIIDNNYSGDVYTYNGKSINFRFTSNHTILYKTNPTNKNIKKDYIKNVTNKKALSFLHSENNNFSGIPLSNELIKLYMLIQCDGTIKKETNLIRIRVKKKRKIKYIENILNKLDIHFKEYTQKDEMVSINFYLPNKLKKYKLKGGDLNFIKCNKQQTNSIFEAYQYGDGYKNGKGIIIYSAKEKEIDILQAIFCLNEYSTTKYSRKHKNSYSNKTQYQLCVFPTKWKTTTKIKENLKKESIINEPFWCIQSKNKNFIMRRNGRVHITGNCHGNLKPIYDKDGNIYTAKRLDVGVDSHNFYPISLDQVHKLVDNINLKPIDHHETKEDT